MDLECLSALLHLFNELKIWQFVSLQLLWGFQNGRPQRYKKGWPHFGIPIKTVMTQIVKFWVRWTDIIRYSGVVLAPSNRLRLFFFSSCLDRPVSLDWLFQKNRPLSACPSKNPLCALSLKSWWKLINIFCLLLAIDIEFQTNSSSFTQPNEAVSPTRWQYQSQV